MYYYVEIEVSKGVKGYIGIEDTTDGISGRRLIAYTFTDYLRKTAIRY
jgi:hypothetical protein